MTAYVVFLIVLWIGIIAMLIGAAVVLLALFGGGTAICVACRRLTGIRRMKKKLVVVGISLGILVGAVISTLVWKAFTATDPYLVKPLTFSPAPVGATVGHTLEGASRSLSIVSSNDVVVVADPGASFKYEVLWLVERPRKGGASTLMEYKCELPQYAAADQINPIGSRIPPKVQQVADGSRW